MIESRHAIHGGSAGGNPSGDPPKSKEPLRELRPEQLDSSRQPGYPSGIGEYASTLHRRQIPALRRDSLHYLREHTFVKCFLLRRCGAARSEGRATWIINLPT